MSTARKEREKAREYWASLSPIERMEIGDELVLGNLDLLRWFEGKKQTAAFLLALDNERMLWESMES